MGYMGSYYNIPNAIFYLLKEDYKVTQAKSVGFHIFSAEYT